MVTDISQSMTNPHYHRVPASRFYTRESDPHTCITRSRAQGRQLDAFDLGPSLGRVTNRCLGPIYSPETTGDNPPIYV